MRTGVRRATESWLLAGSTVLAAGACAAFWHGPRVPPIQYDLVVNNHSDFEVVVYAVPSPGSQGLRIGNARSLSTTEMKVPRNALQVSDVLVLNIRSIGSARGVGSWTLPGTQLDSGAVALLDVRSDPNGDLSGSSLYAEIRGNVGNSGNSTRSGERRSRHAHKISLRGVSAPSA